MGEKLSQHEDELPPAVTEPTEFIDLREPVGLQWYESEYGDDIELFGQNIALGLAYAVRELEETFTLGTDFYSKVHGQPALSFIKDTVHYLIDEENRPAKFTSLLNSFSNHMGFSSPDILTSQLGDFLERLEWYETNVHGMSYDDRVRFQELPEWADSMITIRHMAEKRLDEGLSRGDMTYQNSNMEDWDEEIFDVFVAPYAANRTDDGHIHIDQKSGLSGQVQQHLAFEAQWRMRGQLPTEERESTYIH